MAREGWADLQPHVVFEQAAVETLDFKGLTIEQGWRLPDGRIVPDPEATALAPAHESVDPNRWILDRSYQVVQLGIRVETAWWEPLENRGVRPCGLALVPGTVVVIDRVDHRLRRPEPDQMSGD
jgi:hypothetical protein